MPISYKSSSEVISESLEKISKSLDAQNQLLEKLIKAVSKEKK